jgi:hypothetical protein
VATWDQLGNRSVRSVQGLTEAPPAALDSSEGVGLVVDSVRGISFWLDAGAGYTITADSGQVDIYFHDADLWGIAPDLVLKVPVGSAGKRRVLLGMVPIVNPRGRLAMFTNGIQAGNTSVAIDAMVTNIGGRK